jgi:hypothetical protein
MNDLKRRWLWAALGTVMILSLLWEVVPRPDASARLDRLPVAGFHLFSKDMPLNPVEADIYHGANVRKRIYQAGHEKFILLAIDGTHDRHAVHDPLYCFRGGGWTVGSDRLMPIPGGVARRLDLTKNGGTVEVMYWISDNRTRHASALRAWWQSTLRRLTFGFSGEEPVIFILQPLPGTTVNWDSLVTGFPELFEI